MEVMPSSLLRWTTPHPQKKLPMTSSDRQSVATRLRIARPLAHSSKHLMDVRFHGLTLRRPFSSLDGPGGNRPQPWHLPPRCQKEDGRPKIPSTLLVWQLTLIGVYSLVRWGPCTIACFLVPEGRQSTPRSVQNGLLVRPTSARVIRCLRLGCL